MGVGPLQPPYLGIYRPMSAQVARQVSFTASGVPLRPSFLSLSIYKTFRVSQVTPYLPFDASGSHTHPNHQPRPTNTPQSPRQLFTKYGKVAFVVHWTVYFTGIGSCYAAIKWGNVDLQGKLQSYGLMPSSKHQDITQDADLTDADPSPESWITHAFEKGLTGAGGTLALAAVCNKFLFPIRTPITITLTPLAARALERLRHSVARP